MLDLDIHNVLREKAMFGFALLSHKSKIDAQHPSEVQLQSGVATVDLTEGDANTDAGKVPPQTQL